MKLMTYACLCLVVILAIGGDARACGPSYSPYFRKPSYIDPDYKPPAYADAWYNRRYTFDIVFRQYGKLQVVEEISRDSSARDIGRRGEDKYYSIYMEGAAHFQAQSYDSALKVYNGLRLAIDSVVSSPSRIFGEADYSWVREASTYMIARCQLIISQDKWDGWWDPVGNVDQRMLRSADSSYLRYLAEYPDGLYANSARNIRRKIYVLSGQQAPLDQVLKHAMLEQFPIGVEYSPARAIDRNVVDEFLNYFRGKIDFANDAPILLAFAWLGSPDPEPQDLITLEAREADFSGYPGLFRFVRALGLYRLGRYQELLDGTPEEQQTDTPLWLSTELLRARSFLKLGNTRAALAAFERMHAVSPEDQVDVEIATLQLNDGSGLLLFTDASPVTSERNLQEFALAGLSDEELELGISRHQISAAKRPILVNELAKRYILSGRFKELSQLLDKEQVPVLSEAQTLVVELAADPHNVATLADMGEFLFKNDIRPTPYFDSRYWNGLGDPASDLPRCEPCRGFRERVATFTPPMWFFLQASENARRSHRKSEAEAKALHYIVRGERYGYWRDRCTWNMAWADDTTRVNDKKAFQRLHKLYKKSPWAAATPYYYR